MGLLRSSGAMGGGNQGSDIGMTPGEEEQCNRGRGNATAGGRRVEKLVVMMQRMLRGILIQVKWSAFTPPRCPRAVCVQRHPPPHLTALGPVSPARNAPRTAAYSGALTDWMIKGEVKCLHTSLNACNAYTPRAYVPTHGPISPALQLSRIHHVTATLAATHWITLPANLLQPFHFP